MNTYYVYQHKLQDGTIFYVGKGCNKRAFSTRGRNYLWKQVVKENKSFIVEIKQDNLTEEQAQELEIKTIKEIGLQNLTNLTDESLGGDIRKYLSEEQYNQWIERKRKAATGKVGYYKGKKRPNHSEKLKRLHEEGRYSYSWMSKPKTEEHKSNMSKARTGMKLEKIKCNFCDRKISTNNIKSHVIAKHNGGV